MVELTPELIKEYLSHHNLMQIATPGDNHPWIASVYYTFDDSLQLYFLSDPATIHCRQIAQNSNVAVAITDTRQDMGGFKKGVQMWGTANQISDVSKIKHALSLWKDYLKVQDPEFTYENMVKNVISGRMYQVIPKKIKFFNQELFPVKDGEEPFLDF